MANMSMEDYELREYRPPSNFTVRCLECNYRSYVTIVLKDTCFGIKVVFRCDHCGQEKESW